MYTYLTELRGIGMHRIFHDFERRAGLVLGLEEVLMRAAKNGRVGLTSARIVLKEDAFIEGLNVPALGAGQNGIGTLLRQRKEFRQQVIGGFMNRQRDADGLRGAAGDSRGGKRAVPVFEPHFLHRQSQAFRRVLGLHGLGSHAHLLAGCLYQCGAVGKDADSRRRNHSIDGIGSGSDALADHPITVALHAHRGRAILPAKFLRTHAISLAQVAARKIVIADRIFLGLIDESQLDGIQPHFIRQGIQSALDGECSNRFARRAHKGVGHTIHVGNRLANPVGFHRVQMPGGKLNCSGK